MPKNMTGAQYAATKYNEYRVNQPTTLVEFLSLTLSGTSRNRIKDLLRGRAIAVDRQTITRHDHPLQAGQIVRVSKHRRKTELQSPWLEIVYEDKDLIVINKRPGILSMGASAKQFCVKTVLDEYFSRRHFKCHAHVVHRLDRETSGLMVYAKSIEAARILQEDWKGRCFDRRYVAVLCGQMSQPGGTAQSWLKDNKACVTYSSPEDNGGKYAVTHYRRIQGTAHFTLVELRLDTGRKNQIRVHMADLGFPVAGDAKYGNGQNPLRRLALHAFRLFLYHPLTNERMEFETPLPTPFLRITGSTPEDVSVDCEQ